MKNIFKEALAFAKSIPAKWDEYRDRRNLYCTAAFTYRQARQIGRMQRGHNPNENMIAESKKAISGPIMQSTIEAYNREGELAAMPMPLLIATIIVVICYNAAMLLLAYGGVRNLLSWITFTKSVIAASVIIVLIQLVAVNTLFYRVVKKCVSAFCHRRSQYINKVMES